jgi:GTP-binding protein
MQDETAHRSSHKNYADEERLRAIRQLSLDDFLEFIAEDELLEVTPQSLRARKKVLDNERRMKEQKAREKLLAAQ